MVVVVKVVVAANISITLLLLSVGHDSWPSLTIDMIVLLLCIAVAVQSTSSTCESLDLINSTTAKSAVDGPSDSAADNSQTFTGDISDCSSGTSRPASVTATKHATKTTCGESDPRDIVARIYHEELQKLAATAKTNGNFAEYIMYERELERLAQTSTLAAEPLPPVSSPAPPRRRKDSRHSDSSKRSVATPVDRNTVLQTVSWPAAETLIVDHPEDLRTKSSQSRMQVDNRDTNSANQSDVTASGSVHSTPDVHCGRTNSASSTDLPSPATDLSITQQDVTVVKSEDLSTDVDASMQQLPLEADGDCSPLDLMRTIADSVTSKSHKKSASTETPRYALPPITADQLKRCSYLNTDEVVAAVRSTLADYSISQRLFGEAVLGLSQVSCVLYH